MRTLWNYTKTNLISDCLEASALVPPAILSPVLRSESNPLRAKGSYRKWSKSGLELGV